MQLQCLFPAALLELPSNVLLSQACYGLVADMASSLIDGRKERVQFDKITARVSRLCYGLDGDHVDAAAITQKVISGVYQGVTTIELDNLVLKLLLPPYMIVMLTFVFT